MNSEERRSNMNFMRLANHALRTPLTVVSGCLTLLESFTEIEREQSTELISKGAVRCKEASIITADVMVITETFLSTKAPTVRESDLKTLLIEAFEDHSITLNFPNEDVHVLVNEIDFVSAVGRLITSSVRWGEVRVEVVLNERGASIQIFDKGPLISQTEEELFVKFENFEARGLGIHSLSHIYAYVLLQANDAHLCYSNRSDEALTEIQLEILRN